jgi:hypothetical protein
MTWTDILKRPNISMPDYDRNFEYDPEMLERLVKDWDKNNPAKVLYIEAPSTPDPKVRMDDETIRFAASGSKKYLKNTFKFVTDRPIDDQKGLLALLKEKGYTAVGRRSNWIRRHYGENLGRIKVNDEAVMYLIGISKELGRTQRRKYPNRPSLMPDRNIKVEDLEEWNRIKSEYKLDNLENFAKYVLDILESKDTNARIMNIAERELKGALGRNKHDLYLTQRLPLNTRWVTNNIVKPVLNIIKEEEKQEAMRQRDRDMRSMGRGQYSAKERGQYWRSRLKRR